MEIMGRTDPAAATEGKASLNPMDSKYGAIAITETYFVLLVYWY
jgi:hypothetical protein